jgi:Ca-activated chloride channel family protein
LKAEIAGSTIKLTPQTLPDLYRGEPVVMMAEAKGLGGNLKVSGMIGETPWEVTLPVAHAAQGKGIDKLWAHRQVADFEVAAALREMTPEAAQKAIRDVALAHQIVSSQTSLIAVDKSPRRPSGEHLSRADIPLNLPSGWNYDKIFGEQPVLDAPALKEREASVPREYLQLALAKAPVPAATTPQTVVLPQTATPAGLMAILSLVLGSIGLALRLISSRSSMGQTS